ncbi:MAG: DUF2922 domain-containing protein [Clostridium sp.]|uniref:DUF2922 domain-containing protein n=1 Tax=Clostridium sp. TaxID=1506 RepID=UPI003EE4C6CB
MLEKVLVMTFENAAGKNLSIKVKDILDELSSESVKAVMNFIKAKGIFTIDGSPITKVLKAEVIATEKTILDLA